MNKFKIRIIDNKKEFNLKIKNNQKGGLLDLTDNHNYDKYYKFYSYFNNTFISYSNNDDISNFCRHIIHSNIQIMRDYINDETDETDEIRRLKIIYKYILTKIEGSKDGYKRENFEKIELLKNKENDFKRFLTFELFNSKLNTILNYCMGCDDDDKSGYYICRTIPKQIILQDNYIQPPSYQGVFSRVGFGSPKQDYIEINNKGITIRNEIENDNIIKNLHIIFDNYNFEQKLPDLVGILNDTWPSDIISRIDTDTGTDIGSGAAASGSTIFDRFFSLGMNPQKSISNAVLNSPYLNQYSNIIIDQNNIIDGNCVNNIRDGILFKDYNTPLGPDVLLDILTPIRDIEINFRKMNKKFSLFYNHINNEVILSVEGSTFINWANDWTNYNMDASIGVIIVNKNIPDVPWYVRLSTTIYNTICGSSDKYKCIEGHDNKNPIYVYGGFLKMAQEIFYGNSGLFCKISEFKSCDLIRSRKEITRIPLIDIENTADNMYAIRQKLINLAIKKENENKSEAQDIENFPIKKYFNQVKNLLPDDKQATLGFTIQGHSLGGAVSHLLYLLMKNCKFYHEMIPITKVITYSSPKTICSYSKTEYDNFMTTSEFDSTNKIITIMDSEDKIPKIPLTGVGNIYKKRVLEKTKGIFHDTMKVAGDNFLSPDIRHRRTPGGMALSVVLKVGTQYFKPLSDKDESDLLSEHLHMESFYFHPGNMVIINSSDEENLEIINKRTQEESYLWDRNNNITTSIDITSIVSSGMSGFKQHRYDHLNKIIIKYLNILKDPPTTTGSGEPVNIPPSPINEIMIGGSYKISKIPSHTYSSINYNKLSDNEKAIKLSNFLDELSDNIDKNIEANIKKNIEIIKKNRNLYYENQSKKKFKIKIIDKK